MACKGKVSTNLVSNLVRDYSKTFPNRNIKNELKYDFYDD